MAIERYGSKTDVVVKLVLVFFVCLLSFSVGTFVGKKFSDNQHRLAQFEPNSAEREVASVEGAAGLGAVGLGAAGSGAAGDRAAHGAQAQEGLSDDEIAKLAEEFVTDEENVTAATTPPADAPAAAPTVAAHANPAGHAAPVTNAAPARNVAEAKPEAAKPLPVAATLAKGETPKAAATAPATANAQAIPSSLPQEVAASAVGKFTVQVASYPSEPEALKMTDSLKAQGFGAFYIKADIMDKKSNQPKTWYRVSVGLFQTQKEADAYKADLLARSKVASAIVQKVTR